VGFHEVLWDSMRFRGIPWGSMRFYDVPMNQSIPTKANRDLTSYSQVGVGVRGQDHQDLGCKQRHVLADAQGP
jgi:hypothetical protein